MSRASVDGRCLARGGTHVLERKSEIPQDDRYTGDFLFCVATMRMMMLGRSIVLLCCLLACPATGLNVNVGRRSAVLGACTSAIGLRPAPAVADDAKPKKYDDDCISKCCAKLQNINKGVGKVEYVSRVEAIAQCKPGCKTTKS